MSALQRKTSDIRAVAEEAYIFGYPLVLMDISRHAMTSVPKPEGMKAPVNQFAHVRAFPDANFTDVVSPNADTLYSSAWLDLTEEPIVLSVPEMGDRYYLMPVLDAWTNVSASPGTRTTGNEKGAFAIVGPNWKGELPEGVQEIRLPTSMGWIIGRTQTNGREDYFAVNAIQDRYKLTPLSHWGQGYKPPKEVLLEKKGADTKTPPAEQVAKLDAGWFFARLNRLMKDNPPASGDADALNRFASIGVAPGGSLKTDAPKDIEDGKRSGQSKIISEAKKSHGKQINGWDFMPDLGRYGTNYLWRSVVALVGLGANLPEDAIYPRATTSADGKPLNGARRYEVHFAKGQLPPVNAFWSLTLYNSRQAFVANPMNRFAIGDRDKLKMNSDGSLTLYVQHDSPGSNKESNWLPAPQGVFNLFMRLYWPKQEVIDGTWKAPAIQKVEARQKQAA